MALSVNFKVFWIVTRLRLEKAHVLGEHVISIFRVEEFLA
jgi:hypothetical protein